MMTAITMRTAFICAVDVRFGCIIRSEAHKTHGDHSSRSRIWMQVITYKFAHPLTRATDPTQFFGTTDPKAIA